MFDVHVIKTDTPSYVSLSYAKVSENAVKDKERKHLSACKYINATSVDGCLGKEFQSLPRSIAEKLRENWKKPYSLLVNWITIRIICSTLRAMSICLRIIRKKWGSPREFEDRAEIS